MVIIGNSWDEKLKEEFDKEYYQNLRFFLTEEYKKYVVYPSMYDIFNALKYTPFENVKVVISGQDPYHNKNEAHGLSFSVKEGVKIPPSLKNIFKEYQSDTGYDMPSSGDLTSWAKEGVLLLNSILTVRENNPLSHAGKGWEILTSRIIELLNESDVPKVFILWGSNAIDKEKLITNKMHYIIKAPHPSPLSCYRGFFGSKPFSKANLFLRSNDIKEINWKL